MKFDTSSDRHVSLTSLDVGFDLRESGIPAELPRDVECVRYDDPRTGETDEACGDLREIYDTLARAGYEVQFPPTEDDDS